jgi:hypothetical protein
MATAPYFALSAPSEFQDIPQGLRRIARQDHTTATHSHLPLQPHPQSHPQWDDGTRVVRRQPQRTPPHVYSHNHLALRHANDIAGPSTTQSHPQPPHSATQDGLPLPHGIPVDNIDTLQEQVQQEGRERPETSTPTVRHQLARAAPADHDITHERPSPSFHIRQLSPQISTPLLPRNIHNPLSKLTPNILACARILSGRNLILTMNDIARFARPTFDPLAFLLEHVCESTQVPVKIRSHDLRPALAKLIQSAMTLTPDGFVAAITTHPRTPTGRPRFAYHIPECSLPNPHTVPGTLPFEIVSPLHISGAMGGRFHYCIYAVVPRSSPLAEALLGGPRALLPPTLALADVGEDVIGGPPVNITHW